MQKIQKNQPLTYSNTKKQSSASCFIPFPVQSSSVALLLFMLLIITDEQ